MAEDSAFKSPAAVARAFVEARRTAQAMSEFPGAVPPDLAAAYACQDAAIALWGDEIAGWKIGRVPPELEGPLGASRLAGPIFRNAVWQAQPAGPTPFPVFPGGFAAVEAEFVYVIAADAPSDKLDWKTEEARAMIGAVHIGIETAGSPLAAINDLGPTVVAADFGNNAGLILGAAFEGVEADAMCQTFIDGHSVGRGEAAGIPGGPIESLRFLLENTARRGRPLQRGQYVSTGALTGVHDIVAGQSSRAVFGTGGEIACRAVPALPAA